jgi:hypothetical protein
VPYTRSGQFEPRASSVMSSTLTEKICRVLATEEASPGGVVSVKCIGLNDAAASHPPRKKEEDLDR